MDLRRAVLLLGLLCALTVGCSRDGRELRPARPDQTQSILDPTTTSPPTTIPTAVLSENTVAGAISIDDGAGTGNDVVDDLPIDTVVITAAG